MQLHFDVHGGQGPALLMVHGALTSREQWRPNLAALSRFARPVVVELWGHGRSPAPAEAAAYHPDAYVEQFEAIREEVGCDTWLACGQSLGAALTLRYALDHPDRVRAHVFTNSMSALADQEWADRMREGLDERVAEIEQKGLPMIERIAVHPRYVRHVPDDVKAELVKDSALLDPGGVARTLCHTSVDASVRQRVAENRVPTLLVCGERETRFEPTRKFAEAELPKLEVVGADAGHAANMQAADAFNAAVEAFVARVFAESP